MELEAVEVVITPAGPGNDGLVVLVVIGVALDSIEGCGDVVDIVANAGNLSLMACLLMTISCKMWWRISSHIP